MLQHSFSVRSRKHETPHPVPIVTRANRRKRRYRVRYESTLIGDIVLMLILSVPAYFLFGWLIRLFAQAIVAIGGAVL